MLGGGEQRRKTEGTCAYDVGIDETGHDEFTRLQAHEGVGLYAMTGDGVVKITICIDPEDISVVTDGDESDGEGEKGRE